MPTRILTQVLDIMQDYSTTDLYLRSLLPNTLRSISLQGVGHFSLRILVLSILDTRRGELR